MNDPALPGPDPGHVGSVDRDRHQQHNSENPDNALRAAINEALKAGKVSRAARGRYISAKYAGR